MNYTGRPLRTHLSNNTIDHELRRIIDNLAASCKYIAIKLRESEKGFCGTTNQFGEEQTTLDVLADTIILERLSYETSFSICEFASEEQDKITQVSQGKGRYSVTVDPLDGSSLIDVNLAIGTIAGIHDGNLLAGNTGRDSLVAALYVLYGPDTSLVYAAGKGVHEFRLDAAGNWVLTQENIQLEKKGGIFSPGGLRRDWLPEHCDFIAHLENTGYKLRYSGALAADLNQVLLKKGGIFCYPALQHAPAGKLRLLFELQPLAYIMEQAGGGATDGKEDILAKIPNQLDERSPIYIGSSHEVDLARTYLDNSP